MASHLPVRPRGNPLNALGIGIGMALLWTAVASQGCNQGLGIYTLGVGSTPNKPPGSSLKVLGRPGMQFTASVSDFQSTWLVRGSIPLSVVLVNSTTPVRMIATKLSPGYDVMSLQLTVGYGVKNVASTSAPFGTVSLQSAATAPGFSPPPPAASPDVRFFVKGPQGERFSGLIEDTKQGYIVSDRSPTLYLFENPVGKVDGVFSQIQNLGPFDIDLIVNGAVVFNAVGGPTLSLKEP